MISHDDEHDHFHCGHLSTAQFLFNQQSFEVGALRITISFVAGLAGLVLLGCAIFGQPKLYFREVRQQWNALVEPSPADVVPPAPAPSDPEGDSIAQQVERLQQQVMQLRDQLAAAQFAADQARQQLASLQQQQAVMPPGSQLASSQASQQSAYSQPQQTVLPVDRTADQTTNPVGAERHEAPKPPPPPKSGTDKASARVEPADMQAVLARLRQRPTPLAQPVDNPALSEPPNRPPLPSPSRKRLAMARAALMNGRIDDARRLLQQVQLQMVFRPVGSGDFDAASAGQGASDVANALGALGGNDTLQSQHYIERAMDDVAGANQQETESASDTRLGGYAPAYPPR